MNPILVDVFRGNYIESVHRGIVCVINENAQEIMSIGNINKSIFPRSAIKIIQALPVVESGAAKALKINDKQLSLICSSHNGELKHIKNVLDILKASKLKIEDLKCGSHMPYDNYSKYQLIKNNIKPCALHNNCSGKHSGILTYIKHVGLNIEDYTNIEHPAQIKITKIISDMTECDLVNEFCSIDGCSLPTWSAPLRGWALAFAKISRGTNLSEIRAKSFKKLQNAVMNEPFYVAGTKRYCTEIMTKLSIPIFVKTGAEGVFCASLPNHGIGIALKCEDGLTRGAEIILSSTLKKLDILFNILNDTDKKIINQFISVDIKNCNGYKVSKIIPSKFWKFL